MFNYEYLQASDGTGEAVLANIEANRIVGSTTLQVDNTENFPQKFLGSAGDVDVDGYLVPGTITQFYGHLDAGNIIIDSYVPGYTDIGNTKDQKVFLKQTTHWADTIAHYVQQFVEDLTPAGTIAPYAARVVPNGWLLCDGTAVSRSTYSKLFLALNPSIGTFTVTIATPGVFTLTNHGFETSDGVYFTTTGALPTGLAQNTQYFAIKVDANTFRLATTRANADAGTAIATTGVQSGIHTVYSCPYGVGNGTTTFNVPDYRGRVLVGRDASQPEFNTLGKNVGAKTHTLTVNEMPSHNHGFSSGAIAINGGSSQGVWKDGVSSAVTTSRGGDQPHNNLQPSASAHIIIKT